MKISKIKIVAMLVVVFMFGTVFIVHADTATTTDITTDTDTSTSTDIDTATTTEIETATTTEIETVTATPTTNIHLIVTTDNQKLYDNNENVSPCESSPGSGTTTISGYCAIIQSGLATNWSWYGTDGFLNSINSILNDFSNTYTSWSWFNDLNYGSISLSAHTLTSGENLLINYNISPLKLSVSNPNPTQHDTVTLTLSQFSLDSNYNPVWNNATSGSIIVNGTSNPVLSDGTFLLTLDNTTPYTISGSETGFVDSNIIILNPTATTTTDILGSNGGDGRSILPSTFSIPNAISYFSSVQDSSGSFSGSNLYTDWVSVALGASGSSNSSRMNILSYMKTHNTVSSFLTENERHGMALLSLGQNPYSFNGTDFITPIVKSFDGTQFGDSSIYNDDIFALIPLSSSGYTSSDAIIIKDVSFLLGKQQPNGSWDGSVDLTSAAIMALKPFSDISGVSNALLNAGTYVANNQGNDGGWGNIYSSSWATQAMNSLNASWIKGGKSTSDYFASRQEKDGAVLPSSDTLQNRIWATSYAVPAVLGKTWTNIMQPVSKPTDLFFESGDNNIKNVSTSTIQTVTPTTVVENIVVATTTNLEILAQSDLQKNTTTTTATTTKKIISIRQKQKNKPFVSKSVVANSITQKQTSQSALAPGENNLTGNVWNSGLFNGKNPNSGFSILYWITNLFF